MVIAELSPKGVSANDCTLVGMEQYLEEYMHPGSTLIHAPVVYEPTTLEKELASLAQKLDSRLIRLTLSTEIAARRKGCYRANCLNFPYHQFPNPVFIPDTLFSRWWEIPYEPDSIKRGISTANTVFDNGARYIFLVNGINDIKATIRGDEEYVGYFLEVLLRRATDYPLEFIRFDSRSGRGNHLLIRRL